MSDIKFFCPKCRQPLEAPADIAGQLIDCPTCNTPVEIPFSAQTVPIPPNSSPRSMPIARQPKPATHKPEKKPKFGLIISVVILAVVCLGLFGFVAYMLLDNGRITSTIQDGTPIPPTKENPVLAEHNIPNQSTPRKPEPDITLDGEVFIVTKGGESIKLGLVEVAIIPMEQLKLHLQSKAAARENEYERLNPLIKENEAIVERLDKETPETFNAYMNSHGDPEKKKKYEQTEKEFSDARSKGIALAEEHLWYYSGEFYFKGIPAPSRTTKTNSDGRFRLLIPSAGEYAIAAVASRHIMGETERYYWLLKVDSKAGTSQTIMLSNDNLTSSRSPDSLIETP